ncbi:MAG: response regulator transcription factor [Nitrospinae bacterium]|nr:response regulator transcription factor [Nitrospinota bacterium]
MPSNKKIKVTIADDHAIVRTGIKRLLDDTTDMELLDEAENGNELMDKLRQAIPDVVIMDISMPGRTGWDMLVQLKIEYPKLPVIIFSMFSEEEYAVKFFKKGAAGYLNKTSADSQVVEAVRKVAKGGRYISSALAEKLAFSLDEDYEKPLHENLSPREFQVLCLIGSGKTVKEIAGELSLSVPTISTHRAKILEKMSMNNSSQLMRYALTHILK